MHWLLPVLIWPIKTNKQRGLTFASVDKFLFIQEDTAVKSSATFIYFYLLYFKFLIKIFFPQFRLPVDIFLGGQKALI